MPTINKSFLLKLVLAFIAVTGALFAVHTVQSGRIPDALKQQAERAAESGKTDVAIHYLRQYLEFQPEDVDTRERLATLIRERPGGYDASGMLFLYDRILRDDPTREEVRREALTLCLRMARYSDAETHAGELLQTHETDGALWQKLAAAQAGLHKTEDARKSYEAAIRHDPKNITAYQRYAQYLWRDLNQTPEAKAILDRLVTELPDQVDAYLTRARFTLYASETGNATADLKKALEVAPENLDALMLSAEQLQRRRELTAARDHLTRAIELHPDDIRPVRALAWLELNRGNLGAAVSVLEAGMDRIEDGFDLLVPLADLLVQLGETERTQQIIRKLETRDTRAARMQIKYLRARVAMRELDWPQAATILGQLRTEAVSYPALESQANLLLALCYQRQADVAQEQETLRLVLNRDPNHLAARVTLAQSYLNEGRIPEAIREYELAVRSPYANGTTHASLLRLKTVQLQVRGGKRSEWDALEKVALELHRSFNPAAPEPVLLRAEVAQARGELPKAIEILRTEATRRPGDARIWAALANTVADQSGIAHGLSIIDEAQAAAGDGPDLRLARADLYARSPARLRPIAPLSEHTGTWPDSDQLKLLYGLAEIYDRLGDDAAMIAVYKQVVARRPGDLSVWETVAERAIRTGDRATFDMARTAITKLDTTGKAAAMCDAWQALTEQNTSKMAAATQAMEKAFGTVPARAEACVTLARLKAATDPESAQTLFDRALLLEPTRFAPVQEYLAFLLTRPADERLPRLLSRLLQDHRWSGEPFRRVISSTTRLVAADTAKKLLTSVQGAIVTKPGGYGWLGDLYLAVGLPTEALACYQQAIVSPHATADDYFRLIVRATDIQQPDLIASTLTTAHKKLAPGEYYALAAAYADAPRTPKNWAPVLTTATEQRLYAQSRLALKLSRYQRTEAMAVLEGFLQTENIPASDQAWARRNLAMLYAIRGSAEDRSKAMQLLTQAGDSVDGTTDEKRATAAVLAALSRYLDGEERKSALSRATKVLEKLVQETQSARDGFLLAQMYRATGNRKASTAMMNQLLQADPRNLDYHLVALEELTELGQLAEAEPFAQRLTALYPNEFRAVSAVARYECKSDRPERALSLAEGYLRTADASSADLPAKSAQVAELLDQLARLPGIRRTEAGRKMVNAAVKRYEDLILTRPEAIVAAAGLYAADARMDASFALIAKYGKPMPPRLKAAAGLAALRAGGASQRQFEAVRGWLDQALASEPQSIPVRLNEAEFFALQQDYAAAEKGYLGVLKTDPKNVVALNNLAWILAPRPESSARALELIDRAVSEVGLTGELLDTRARVRIAARQFELAERDLQQALSQKKTPLRMFHLALARQTQSPPKASEATDAFRKAKDRGLEPTNIHPADLPAYRVLDASVRVN